MKNKKNNKNKKHFFVEYSFRYQLFFLVGILIVGGVLSWTFVGITLAKSVAGLSTGIDWLRNIEQEEVNPQEILRDLRGQIVPEDETVPYPMGVMIENLPSTRPQSGLQNASIVYETFVEGLATRFLVMYEKDGLTEIGPVRSARPYYTQWVSEYDSLYAHCGGSPEALINIYNWKLNSINQIGGDWQYYWRDSSKGAPHNLYTSSELLYRALVDKGLADSESQYLPWSFKEDLAEEERPTEEKYIKLPMSGGSWAVEYNYDPAQNNYLRSNGGYEHQDKNTGKTIRVKNVVVQIIPEIVAFGELGRLTLEIEGGGEALVFIDGGYNIGTWKKEGTTDRTMFYYSDGTEVEFNVGNTWITVVPIGYETVEYN